MRPLLPILCLAAVFASSCASKSDSNKATSTTVAGFKPMSQRLEENNGYKVDTDGNWVPKTDKRSAYDGSSAPAGINGEVGKKTYQTGELKERSWWGNKNFGNQQYGGNTKNTRYDKSSKYSGRNSRESSASPEVSGSYGTGTLSSNSANESGRSLAGRRSSSEGKRHADPEIIDWKEQRSLSLEQSKGILGR